MFGEAMARAEARARPPSGSRARLPSARRSRVRFRSTAGSSGSPAKGDQFPVGWPPLFADGRFATPDGKAHFTPVRVQEGNTRPGRAGDASVFRLSTRRGKQFNSMVQREVDPLTGAARDDVLMSDADMAALGFRSGQRVRLRATGGTFSGRVRTAPIKPGNLEIHWPEGNILLSGEAIDPDSMEPDYNATVTIESMQDE